MKEKLEILLVFLESIHANAKREDVTYFGAEEFFEYNGNKIIVLKGREESEIIKELESEVENKIEQFWDNISPEYTRYVDFDERSFRKCSALELFKEHVFFYDGFRYSIYIIYGE